jgi:hypothetical protein
MRKFYGFIIYLSLFLLVLSISILLVTQVSYEKYILFQKKEYKILENRNRLSYKPAVIYYIESIVINNKELNKDALEILRIGSEFKSFKINYIKDEYILECYYTKVEKERFVIEKKKTINE